MPRAILTDRSIQAMKPPESGQAEVFDTALPGFGLRLSRGGKKSFVVMYRNGRRLRRLTLGPYPHLSLADARKLAREALHDAAHGADPATQKQVERSAETFAELAAEYLERHARDRKRSWREDERILRHDLLPALGKEIARSITRRQVRDLLDQIAERGAGVMANRTLALVRKIFNFARERDIVEVNPCSGLTGPALERHRDRVLTQDEIAQIWSACDDEPAGFAGAIRLYLLTAQRKDEVLGARWDEIDFGSGWWTIPADRAKNGLAHRVPLSPPAERILKELRLRSGGSPFVFPSRGASGRATTVQKPLDRIRERTGIDFRVHDLRRTAASHMTGMGINRIVVSKILNHADRGITAVYDRHSYDGEKRAAVLAWGERLQEIVKGRDGHLSSMIPA